MEDDDLGSRARKAAGGARWWGDIPLPDGSTTGGDWVGPHIRIRRVVQIVSDLLPRPLHETRILDLGCFEGQYALEFALHGAEAVGIEYRDFNLAKGLFLKEAFTAERLSFHQDDALRITSQKYGRFDAIVCSGLLYHLTASDAIDLVARMFEMTNRLLLIDTHVSLSGTEARNIHGIIYRGHTYEEHRPGATATERYSDRWASADNETSFWFTRPSLINILLDAGFASVYECLGPVHAIGPSGRHAIDRCTFVAVKAETAMIHTSPAANRLVERWPEGSLSYEPPSLPSRVRGQVRRWIDHFRALRNRLNPR